MKDGKVFIWMNLLGFEAMTLGNHEFDWGEDAIRDNLACAEFPFLFQVSGSGTCDSQKLSGTYEFLSASVLLSDAEGISHRHYLSRCRRQDPQRFGRDHE